MKKFISVFVALCVFISSDITVFASTCNHVWSEWKVEEKPTCDSEGYEERECSECYEWETRIIPATGEHVWTNWEVSWEADCTDDGRESRSCINCYTYEYRDIPATGIHDWTEWQADGDLCEDGTSSRKCKNCYLEEKKVRTGDGNHLWSPWSVVASPDCLNSGKNYRYCYNCYSYDYVDVPADASMHDWSSWYSTEEPTALHGGTTKRTCYTCNICETGTSEKLDAIVKISSKRKTLKVGKSFVLKIKKITYGDKLLKYSSSNKKVATVNKKGKVTAKKKGKVVITVKMKSGCSAKCNIVVK